MIKYFAEKQASQFGSKKFWSFYKTIVKTKKSNNSNIISNIIDSNNISHSIPIEVANIFNFQQSQIQHNNHFGKFA